MQLQFKISTKGYIASERDVMTEILLNVSTLERQIDALTSWFDNSSGKDQVDTSDPDFMSLYLGNCAVFFVTAYNVPGQMHRSPG